MNDLVSSSSPKPIDTQPNVSSSYQSLETVSPGVQRAKKTPLHTPNFKWKSNKNFHPKTFDFDSSKVYKCYSSTK